MTGEASPGYLPYPDVAKLLHTSLPDPKIIMVGRNPLERSWSSYKYNYAAPTLEEMTMGHVKDMPRGRTKDYYKSFLFTFEELMRAELEQLKKCLDPIHGFGANATRSLWGKRKWTQPELDRRMSTPYEKTGELQPLMDLDGVCYGERVNRTVLLEQWAELQMKQPHKVMLESNIHLKQSLIGRSLYVFPLEWWYLMYKPEAIYFLCTEELSDLSGRPLNEMASNHLGLPWFNFSSVVAEGAFNVGDNRGYDQATSWEQVAEAEKEDVRQQQDGNAATIMGDEDGIQNGSNNGIVTEGAEIPLSAELLQDLQEFIRPINERLYELVGRRCNW
jgi:hypothetical protein